MSVELKPCPFCGSTASIVPREGDRSWVQCAGCDTCGPLSGAFYLRSDERRAASAAGRSWNSRAENPGCAQHSPAIAKAAMLLKDCRRLLPGSTLGDRLRSRIGAALREWGES